MSQNKLREKRAIALTRKLIHGFYEKTLHPKDMSPYLSPTCFVWVGAAEGEVYTSPDEALAAYSHQWDMKKVPLIHISEEKYRAFSITSTIILVLSEMLLTVDKSHKVVLSERQRGTHLFHVEHGALKLTHIHVSNPWAPMAKEKQFPLTAGRASYEYMQQLIADKKPQKLPALTPRQKVVLEMLTQGKTYKEIAEALHISIHTVRYHVKGLTHRFKVKNRLELVAAAERGIMQKGL